MKKSTTNVMIVEDDGIIANRLLDTLEREAYKAIIVDKGEDAVQQITQCDDSSFDLIIMDIRLKGMIDGVEAAERIHAFCDIPIIFLTAYSDEDLIQRAKKTTPFGYLMKPLRTRELIAAIEMALFKYQIDKQNSELKARIYSIRKHQSLGLMAGSIVHHYNNFLMIVQGNAEMLSYGSGNEELVINASGRILKAITKYNATTQQILKYTGNFPDKSIHMNINLFSIIQEMKPIIEMTVPDEINLKYNLNPDILPVRIDSSDIMHIVIELVSNASESIINSSGSIQITTGQLPKNKIHASELPINYELDQDFYVFFEISDDGCGMDIETTENMFDPFFSTKCFGRGLGLASVSGIVKKFFGALHVDSSLGKGTKIKVFFPAIDNE